MAARGCGWTEAESAGLTGSELQALMVHEDLSTTQQYIRVTGRDLELAMARLKAWREARDSMTLGVDAHLMPARPRPERLRRPSTESGLQTLSGLFVRYHLCWIDSKTYGE